MQSIRYNKPLSAVGEPDIISIYHDKRGTPQRKICRYPESELEHVQEIMMHYKMQYQLGWVSTLRQY